METDRLTISRDCIEAAAIARGFLFLLASCSGEASPGSVAPTPADVGDVPRDAGARDSGEHFCTSPQCRQMECGPGLPPTSIRGIACP
jgi:hypothetical protein